MFSKRVPATLVPIVLLTAAACAERNPVEPRTRALTRAPAASAAADQTVVPITFTLAGGTCGLAVDVHGTGELRLTEHVVETPLGMLRVTMNASAAGTATGDDGSQYVFKYNSNFAGDFTTFPILLKVVDVFQLVGLNGAPSIHTGFVVDVAIPASGPDVVNFKLIRGNSAQCDPI